MFYDDVALMALRTRLEPLGEGIRIAISLASISGFFTNLYGQLLLFGVAMTVFFLALAGLFYSASVIMTSERARSGAILSMYGALIGLSVVLLAKTLAGVVSVSAKGQ